MNKVTALMLGAALLTAPLAFAQPKPAVSPASTQAVDVGNKFCPVSGEKIGGAMGPGVTLEYKGKIYHFCCPACIPKFKSDPAKYSKIAESQAAAVKADNMAGMKM
ncbi:MAG: YHS domain-containing protein [Candidatus Omnitrophica bacterium]|nr:YHS domain-containing protein [Candidatus Omnitrophota bacterium]MDE2222611.1 YHS domain-containing protein [Candidatus Omnitrophota bacterium]